MEKKILVIMGREYGNSVKGLGEICTNLKEFYEVPKKFGLVLFTGGSDITPEFYNDSSPRGLCQTNIDRDRIELKIAKLACSHGIVMAGICRGLQLLNVFSGGKLMHHIDGHELSTHMMETATGEEVLVNSLHHQMVLPPAGSIITGWSKENRSTRYYGKDDEKVPYDGKEIEAVVYPNTKAIGVQYHPEIMVSASHGYNFFHNMVGAAMSLPWEEFINDLERDLSNGRTLSEHNSAATG